MAYFNIKITQGGRRLRYSDLARSAAQAFEHALAHVVEGQDYTISVIRAEVLHV